MVRYQVVTNGEHLATTPNWAVSPWMGGLGVKLSATCTCDVTNRNSWRSALVNYFCSVKLHCVRLITTFALTLPGILLKEILFCGIWKPLLVYCSFYIKKTIKFWLLHREILTIKKESTRSSSNKWTKTLYRD